ncbi:hypothetical protein L1887_59565 [Cichorium endivia]|nr:hypothetical protein L1887_59565 [Cichorium endivia]
MHLIHAPTPSVFSLARPALNGCIFASCFGCGCLVWLPFFGVAVALGCALSFQPRKLAPLQIPLAARISVVGSRARSLFLSLSLSRSLPRTSHLHRPACLTSPSRLLVRPLPPPLVGLAASVRLAIRAIRPPIVRSLSNHHLSADPSLHIARTPPAPLDLDSSRNSSPRNQPLCITAPSATRRPSWPPRTASPIHARRFRGFLAPLPAFYKERSCQSLIAVSSLNFGRRRAMLAHVVGALQSIQSSSSPPPPRVSRRSDRALA